jgi:thioredoxin 1
MDITAKNFNEFINAEYLTAVDFWAPWCGYCIKLAPVLEAAVSEYGEKITLGKFNCDADEENDLAMSLGIMSIPAVFFYKKGEKVGSFAGFKDKTEIKKIIDGFIG